jgi:hypothetical protein
MVEAEEARMPRILTIDIETSPLVAYSWGPKWETNLIKVLEQSQVICYSAKWLGGEQYTKGLCDYPGYKPGRQNMNDKRLVAEVRSLLDEADIIVTQNGIDFDMKILNTRLLKHGMSPPSPYKNVDTKREAKKYFRMPSNKLDDIGDYFDAGKKMEHEGFPLWERCMEGNEKAWAKMKKYNAQDVKLTEKIYLVMRPFMKTHPNVNSFTEKPGCTACGSEQVQWRGYSRNVSTVYRRYQCNGCGHWDRAPTKEYSVKTNRGV